MFSVKALSIRKTTVVLPLFLQCTSLSSSSHDLDTRDLVGTPVHNIFAVLVHEFSQELCHSNLNRYLWLCPL